MPIYVVTVKATFEKGVTVQSRLIEAKNQAQAISHVVSAHITVDKASSSDLIEMTKAGINLEQAA